MPDRTLEIKVILRDLVSRGVGHLQRGMRGLRGTINSVSNAAFGLKGALAGLGLGLIARSFLKSADNAEQLRLRLNILFGDVQRGNDLFEKAAEYAGSVGHEYMGLMEAATTLSGIVEGSNEDIMEWVRIISDVAAATNISIEETTSNIVRMYSAGAASADLFREKGVLAMLGFTAGVSYSADETRRTLLEMFRDPESALRGAAQRMESTWKGLMSMLADHWEQFKQKVMGEGVFSELKAYAAAVLDKLNQLKAEGKLDEWARKMSESIVKGLESIALSAAVVSDIFRGWQMIWQGLKAAFATVILAVQRGFNYLFGSLSEIIAAYRKLLELQKSAASGSHGLWQGIKEFMIPGSTKLYGKGETPMSWLAQDTEVAIQKLKGLEGAIEGSDIEGWAQSILKSSVEQLEVLASQESAYSRMGKLLKELKDLQKKWADEAKDQEFAGGGIGSQRREKVATIQATLDAELARFKADQAAIEAVLQSKLERGLIGLQEYFDERQRLMQQAYEKELAIAEQRLNDPKITDDPDKRLKAETAIFQLKKQHEQELTRLALERYHATEQAQQAEADAARLIGQIKNRVSQIGEFGLASQFQSELREMESRQRDEIDQLTDLRKQGIETEEELAEAHRQHELEREKLFQDQKWRLQQEYLNRAKQSFGYIEQAMSDAYEASGEKIKAFFEIQKAAAIASTIISTYQAAQDAYKALAGIKVVGPTLATAAAAAAIAAGMARVAKIQSASTSFAEGGEVGADNNKALAGRGGRVRGHSPHPKSDNIVANLTAREYVHPVNVVDHYGVRVMEAIRQKAIPRNLLSGLANGAVSRVSTIVDATAGKMKMADGGLVQGLGRTVAAASGADSAAVTNQISVPLTVNNEDYLARLLQTEIERTTVEILKRETK